MKLSKNMENIQGTKDGVHETLNVDLKDNCARIEGNRVTKGRRGNLEQTDRVNEHDPTHTSMFYNMIR